MINKKTTILIVVLIAGMLFIAGCGAGLAPGVGAAPEANPCGCLFDDEAYKAGGWVGLKQSYMEICNNCHQKETYEEEKKCCDYEISQGNPCKWIKPPEE